MPFVHIQWCGLDWHTHWGKKKLDDIKFAKVSESKRTFPFIVVAVVIANESDMKKNKNKTEQKNHCKQFVFAKQIKPNISNRIKRRASSQWMNCVNKNYFPFSTTRFSRYLPIVSCYYNIFVYEINFKLLLCYF